MEQGKRTRHTHARLSRSSCHAHVLHAVRPHRLIGLVCTHDEARVNADKAGAGNVPWGGRPAGQWHDGHCGRHDGAFRHDLAWDGALSTLAAVAEEEAAARVDDVVPRVALERALGADAVIQAQAAHANGTGRRGRAGGSGCASGGCRGAGG